MSDATFQVKYAGPALESGQMDVRELAPALLSIGKLLEESNRVFNENRASVSVNVKSFQDGSFSIVLDVVQSLTNQFITLFSGPGITAGVNLIALLGLGGGGVIGLLQLLKRLRGEKPNKITRLQNGNVMIEFSGQTFEVDSNVVELYRDIPVRKAIENSLLPISREGIDKFEVLANKEPIESVTKEEFPYYQIPSEDEYAQELIDEQEIIATYSIISLTFKEDNKWRLSDGTNTFYVTISDSDFLGDVNNNNISFSKGDLLKIKLLVKSWRDHTGFKTEYEALKILEHKKAVQQLKLNFHTNSEDESQ